MALQCNIIHFIKSVITYLRQEVRFQQRKYHQPYSLPWIPSYYMLKANEIWIYSNFLSILSLSFKISLSFHSSFFRFFANLKLTEEFLFGRENVKIFMEFYYIVSHFIRRKISAIVFYWILNFLIQKSLSKNLA